MTPAIPHIVGSFPSVRLRARQASPLRQYVEVALALPVGHGREVSLPLVALVVHEHIVETSRQRALDDVVFLERRERLSEVFGHAWDVHALGQDVVHVALLRRARGELPPYPVEGGP